TPSWQGRRTAVACDYAGDGGGIDRSRVVAERGAALSRAAVAAATDGLRTGGVENRDVERPMCVQRQANRAGRGLENLFRVRMTGVLSPLRREGGSAKKL